ncbi:hypothetical protein HanRHA438_Chr09g0423381 [Helianthus annuus]|nr:hypothetical protein HanRHA438_Chr09g0423381 [Helianthus annuus]
MVTKPATSALIFLCCRMYRCLGLCVPEGSTSSSSSPISSSSSSTGGAPEVRISNLLPKSSVTTYLFPENLTSIFQFFLMYAKLNSSTGLGTHSDSRGKQFCCTIMALMRRAYGINCLWDDSLVAHVFIITICLHDSVGVP